MRRVVVIALVAVVAAFAAAARASGHDSPYYFSTRDVPIYVKRFTAFRKSVSWESPVRCRVFDFARSPVAGTSGYRHLECRFVMRTSRGLDARRFVYHFRRNGALIFYCYNATGKMVLCSGPR